MDDIVRNAVAVAFLAIVFVLMQWQIVRVCRRTENLHGYRYSISTIFALWFVFITMRLTLLQDVFIPSDALSHEMHARAVARELDDGRFARPLAEFRAGNPAYRFLVGVGYALTGAPEYLINFINGTLGFWAMLALLEVIAREWMPRKIPFWLLGMTVCLPSAVFWSTTHLKEGPAIWGIMMIVDAAASSFRGVSRPGKFLAGLAVVGLMRPHIAIGWTTAMAIGFLMQRGGYWKGLICLAAALICWQIVVQIRPEITENFENDGVVATMESRYVKHQNIGGSAIRRETPPIPVVSGLAMILLRPYPYELFGWASTVAGAEVWTLTGICCVGWIGWLRRRPQLPLPLIMASLAALASLAFFLGYTFNLGLMVRQRLQVMPALVMLTALPVLFAYDQREWTGERPAFDANA